MTRTRVPPVLVTGATGRVGRAVVDLIDLTFATIRHRTKVTKGPGSKATGIAMAFKLIEASTGAQAEAISP